MSIELYNTGILGTGSAVPDKIITNQDLEKMVDTSDEWITKRTGIKTRHILEENQPLSQMISKAAKNALDNAGVKPEQLDMIIVATATPDYSTPSMACILQNDLGITGIPVFDLNAACTGFIYALETANHFIRLGTAKYILLCGSDGLSRITDWTDRNTCVLFGDGAGAVVLGRTEKNTGILATTLGADGSSGRCITIPFCYMTEEDIKKRNGKKKNFISMDGSEVFKFAVRIMEQETKHVMKKAGLTTEDVKLIIPHQANIRILNGAVDRLDVGDEKIFINVDRYGNMASASIPVSLDEANRRGLLKKDDIVIIVGFGGGLTWGASAIKWII